MSEIKYQTVNVLSTTLNQEEDYGTKYLKNVLHEE